MRNAYINYSSNPSQYHDSFKSYALEDIRMHNCRGDNLLQLKEDIIIAYTSYGTAYRLKCYIDNIILRIKGQK